jgi:hypothetical protein
MLKTNKKAIRMEKRKCPDCIECQMCSKTRCRACRQGVHRKCECALVPGITYGQYLEWKRKNNKLKGGD